MSRNQDKENLRFCKASIQSMTDAKLIDVYKFLYSLRKYKKYAKLHQTYVEGVKEALKQTGNGKMYVNYNIDGAVTGRISNTGSPGSSRKDPKIGVSFHTLPREFSEVNIRDYVVAPPEHKFITIDMKAMELRVLAHVAKEQRMIQAFKDGKDLHLYSASMLFKKDESKVTKEERQIAKEVSFLIVYGGNEYTLSSRRGVSESEAANIIESWLRTFPGVREYMNSVRGTIAHEKSIRTIFGRVRNLPNIDSPFQHVREEAFRQGLNFTVQSAASDILLCGILGIDRMMKTNPTEFTRTKLVATVHDSIEVISHESEYQRIIRVAADELINGRYMKEYLGIELDVPMEIEVEVGTTFGNGEKYHL